MMANKTTEIRCSTGGRAKGLEQKLSRKLNKKLNKNYLAQEDGFVVKQKSS